jgi:hypothetical protein
VTATLSAHHAFLHALRAEHGVSQPLSPDTLPATGDVPAESLTSTPIATRDEHSVAFSLLQLSSSAPVIAAAADAPHTVQARTVVTNATPIATSTTTTPSVSHIATPSSPPLPSAGVKTRSAAAKQGVENPTYARLDTSGSKCLLGVGVLQTALPSGAHKMIFLAMHFRKDVTKCPDSERVMATVRASTRHPYFLSVTKAGTVTNDVGYYCSNFRETIMAGVNFKGGGWIAMLDWHFAQTAVWAKEHYGANWPEKCADLVDRGVDIFLMPNLVYFSEKGKPAPGFTWTGEQMTKDWAKVQKKHPNVCYFAISKADALTLHPLVVGTLLAEEEIADSSRPTSNFKTHWVNVQDDCAFIVYYRLRGGETQVNGEKRVRLELRGHLK